jgi:hypothetical protein
MYLYESNLYSEGVEGERDATKVVARHASCSQAVTSEIRKWRREKSQPTEEEHRTSEKE